MAPRSHRPSLWSRQSIHRLEQRVQAIPTWLVALISVVLLAVLVVVLRGDPNVLYPGQPYGYRRKVLNVILDDAEAIAIMVAVILYVKGAPDRKTQKHYEAWRVIDTAAAANVTTSYARNKALKDLHHDGVPLKWLEAPRANLAGIELPKANLECCNLAGTNLEGANLRGANLVGANLIGANLSHVDLVGSDLGSADLSEANLRGANLTGANLWETNFSNAEMRWAELEQAQLNHATLEETILPDGSLSNEPKEHRESSP
ncbi:MAG: pentapeptide repeat-containing protein [Cyanobacteria bacterium P01_D01_bin.36]